MRTEAGMTQRYLAEKLGREHSFVGQIELGDRRVDGVEFFWICRALGEDPAQVATELMEEFGQIERLDDQDQYSPRPVSSSLHPPRQVTKETITCSRKGFQRF